MCPTSDALREGWRTSSRHDGYEVHWDGRVRNARTLRVLAPQQAKSGRYRKVSLGAGRQVQVHQLVAETWLDAPPSHRVHVVDHIDNDGTRCCATNLRWMTRAMNTRQWWAIQSRFEREGVVRGWDAFEPISDELWAMTHQRLSDGGL
jgi:hypothetical protein